jgi:hypothetical protein
MPFRNWIWSIVMANLRRVSEILKEITDEFKKSNDEWEKRYGSADVSRSSNDGAAPKGSIRNIKLCNRGEKDEHTQKTDAS